MLAVETIAKTLRKCLVECRSSLSVARVPGLARIAIRKVVRGGATPRFLQAFGHPPSVISGLRNYGVKGTVTMQRVRATPLMMAVRQNEHPPIMQTFLLDVRQEEALAKRQIGLGVTGLADALLMKEKRYGSNGSVSLARHKMGRIARAAYLASAELAAEKGPFPMFDRDAFLAVPMMQSMDEEVREAVSANGIRNALLTSIAPTGTISLLAGNVSSGIEPVFAYSYNRKVL